MIRDPESGLYVPDRRVIHPRGSNPRMERPRALGSIQMMLAQRMAGGGVAAWYDNFSEGTIDGQQGPLFGSVTWGDDISIPLPAGELSALRFNVRTFTNPTGVKMALYDPFDALVSSIVFFVISTGTKEVSISPVTLSGGFYKATIIGNGNTTDIEWGALNSSGSGKVNTDTAYAAYPPATYPSLASFTDERIWWGAYVTPS